MGKNSQNTTETIVSLWNVAIGNYPLPFLNDSDGITQMQRCPAQVQAIKKLTN